MRFFILVCFVLATSLSKSQTTFPLQLSGSYYSEALLYEQAFSSGSNYYWFNNQGGSLSANYTLLSFDTKGSKAQGNTGSLKLQALLTGAVYQIENQSINTLFTGGLGIEKDFRFGLFLFGNIQAGLLHSNFYVPTYSVNSQGQLIETEAKESYAIAPFSIGFGWSFNRQLGIPIGVKASTFSFYKPYGDSDYLKNGMMIGIEWRFNNAQLPTIKSF
ncbi:MAG: hypothetical protein ACPGLV_01100 [Bacteroidia bacterium]